jgi:Protein of unknown function (DUF2924)
MINVLARVVALKTTPTPALKAMWKELNGSEPPRFSRSYLESRLAYRLQEVEYGGLTPETRARLEALGRELARDGKIKRRGGVGDRPVAGTKLIREWRGVQHTVTVRDDDFEYAGRAYRSLSPIARAITNTRWNGPLFFGLRRPGTAP